MMSISQVRNELADLRRKDARLEQEINKRDSALREALTVEPRFFNEADANEARAQKAATERQRAHLHERIAALESMLPSEDEVRRASADVRVLMDEWIKAGQVLEAEWQAFSAGLEATEQIAQRVIKARQDTFACKCRISAVAEQYGIQPPSAQVWKPAPWEEKYLMLLGMFLSEVSFGDPGDVVTRDLNAARAAREAVRVVAT